MRIAAVADNLLEWALLRLGLVPTPFLDTHVAMLLSRTVVTASNVGLFAALGRERLTAPQVADRCGADPSAIRRLLDALVGAGYLRVQGGRYRLRRGLRRWLTRDARTSLSDQMLWQTTEWRWLSGLERFVRSGEPIRMHEAMSDGEWRDYQRGMLSAARILAPEVARRTPVPRGARQMLDVGGAHGLFSAALCRRNPGLHATVLDLPEAVRHAAPLLASHGLGERLVHREGDVLRDDLGEEAWDLVFVSQLVHHFDEETNAALAARVARSLRPGGAYVIQDVVRPATPGRSGQVGGLYDLYFALTSEAGTWTFAEMADWQRAAGLEPQRPLRFVTAPGMGQQAARKR